MTNTNLCRVSKPISKEKLLKKDEMQSEILRLNEQIDKLNQRKWELYKRLEEDE